MSQLVSRRVALRVDSDGITLGMSPPWPGRNRAFVPWSDITRIVLWRQTTGASSVGYIGVERPEGCSPLPGSARGPLLKKLIDEFISVHVPVQVAYDSRQISGWRLDHERLAAAVARFAPDVEIIDVG
jgi:hypothetical protein